MPEQIRLGVPLHAYCAPLVETLSSNARFRVMHDSPGVLALQLRERSLDLALLSPLDYARESSAYSIIPGVAVASHLPTNAIVLVFNQGIHGITTLAADPAYASEIVLATILLGEEFETTPQIIPMKGSPEAMLQKADCALLVGDLAQSSGKEFENRIDLTEAWMELTGFPFVHGIWCGRAESLTAEDVSMIQASALEGGKRVLAALADAAETTTPLNGFQYALDPDGVAGVREFLHYLYYHAIVSDVGDIHWFGDETDADEPEIISPN